MELEKTHINEIRTVFQDMQNKEDLLSLMNYVKPLLYGETSVPFELKQLTFYANPKLRQKAYKEFKIKKKSGGERTIHAPVNGLKAIQKCLALIMQCVFEPHKAAMGFVKNKSIVDNAIIHVGNHYVYNIDLKDFFQSIDQARVWKCLQLRPFKLNDENRKSDTDEPVYNTGVRQFTTDNGEEIYYKIKNNGVIVFNSLGDFKNYKQRIKKELEKNEGNSQNIDEEYLSKKVFEDSKKYLFSDQNIKELDKLLNYNRLDLASLIANISCTEMEVERKNKDGNWDTLKRNVLPQGAPTSPVLTNVVCQRLDYLLTAVAKRFGLKYSRYADDITFSSLHNVFQKNSPFLKEMKRVISDQGFTIKESKTRLQVDGIRKSVTGLVVNEKVNVPKRYVKQLRMWLYLWERYGYTKAENIFKVDYFKDKGHVKKSNPNLANVIDGKLNYLKMVKGADDSTNIKLKNRFDELQFGYSNLDKILIEWDENGIDSAMELYNK